PQMENRSPTCFQTRGLQRAHAQEARESASQTAREFGGKASVSATTDLGVTVVELWAEAGDKLATEQEEMAADGYLGTARPLIILDGLLGVGARPPLREPIRAACRSINQLRTNKGAYVLSV